jgi:hypothetical protein
MRLCCEDLSRTFIVLAWIGDEIQIADFLPRESCNTAEAGWQKSK